MRRKTVGLVLLCLTFFLTVPACAVRLTLDEAHSNREQLIFSVTDAAEGSTLYLVSYADSGQLMEAARLDTDGGTLRNSEGAKTVKLFQLDETGRPLSAAEEVDVDAVSSATPREEPENPDKPDTPAGSKVLIAYFSRTGENYSVGVINEGNTAKLAKEIAAQTGGDLFEIVPVTPYPSGYEETKTIATRERNNNERPSIRDTVENFEDYDTIFIGYPVWWGDVPMILHTFMESCDFTGKTIVPFNTHEGSGSAGQRTITGVAPTATALQGFSMRGSTAQALKCDGKDATVKNWLDGLGFGG